VKDPANGATQQINVSVTGASASYSIVEISRPGYYVEVSAINNAGQVAGWLAPVNGYTSFTTFVYSLQSGMQIIGTGIPEGINDAGQVVFNPSGHGYLYTPGLGVQDLVTLGGGPFTGLTAKGINNSGQVVGTGTASGVQHAFVYLPGTGTKDLGVVGGSTAGTWSEARSINDLGQIAVNSTTGATFTAGSPPKQWPIVHAFIYTMSGGFQDLGTLGGAQSSVGGVNNKGQAVGSSETGARDKFGQPITHGYLYTPSLGMQDLCVLGGFTAGCGVLSLNNLGQVLVLDFFVAPFLYSPQSGFVNQNALLPTGWFSIQGAVINDKGQIAGNAYRNKGDFVAAAFLMTPQ
jgi:probable HAF family extracellular repeat protein